MRKIPILFNTEMVRAILDGRKTQTRRIAKYNAQRVYDFACADGKWYETYDPKNPPRHLIEHYLRMGTLGPCIIGDVLYVRETWCKGRIEYGEEMDGRSVPYVEQCTGDDDFIHKEWVFRHDVGSDDVVWRPSIHMPREAARIFLRVTDVYVERLQNITEEDAEREGCKAGSITITGGPWGVEDDPDEWTAIEDFAGLWDSTIKHANVDRYGWHANPYVWVITFERCDKPEGW